MSLKLVGELTQYEYRAQPRTTDVILVESAWKLHGSVYRSQDEISGQAAQPLTASKEHPHCWPGSRVFWAAIGDTQAKEVGFFKVQGGVGVGGYTHTHPHPTSSTVPFPNWQPYLYMEADAGIQNPHSSPAQLTPEKTAFLFRSCLISK